MRDLTTICTALLVGAGATSAHAQWDDAYLPPASYYNSVTATSGAALKAQIQSRTSIAQVQSYQFARDVLGFIDQDPNDPTKCILVYNAASVQGAWSSGGVIWNREHTWPQSKGASQLPLNSDLHALRPCNPSVNSSRGNKNFGIGGTFWDPNALGGPDRGEMARTMFYVDTRYGHVTLVNGNPGGSNQVGDLATLLRWHFDEPAETRERRRNDVVHDNYQLNRNAYVDHPEWVWAVYGGAPNNSQLHLGSPDVDGGSVVQVDFGRTIGAPGALMTDVTLTKTGVHPTTFTLNATGDAGVTGALPHDAMPYDPGTRTLSVSLDASGVPGLYFGEVTIDNTDLTSAGQGMGAADADDTILLTAEVLEASEGSFSPGADLDVLALNFGDVDANSGPVQLPVRIYALGGQKADLDIDSVITPLSSSAITLSGGLPTTVSAGSFVEFILTFDPAQAAGPGVEVAQYVFGVSDEDIAGASSGANLTLSVVGTIVEAFDPADWNQDGAVNDQDFFDFVNDYFTQSGPRGSFDFNDDGFENDQDWFDFVNAYF